MKRLLFVFVSSFVTLVLAGQAVAISSNDWFSILNNSIYYDGQQQNCNNSGQNSSNKPVSSGSSVYILGDSITELAAPTYQAQFQKLGITANINAQAGRSLIGPGVGSGQTPGTTGLQAISQDTSEIQSASAIVIALGTNGGDTAGPNGTIAQAIQAIRADNSSAPIYWIDTIAISGTNPPPNFAQILNQVEQSNQAIYQEAPQLNYSIISWFKTVDPNGDPVSMTGHETDSNGYINVDDAYHVHPTVPAGVNALVNLVVGTLSGTISDNGAGIGSVQNSTCCNISTGATQQVAASKNQAQNAQTIIGVVKSENLQENAALIALMVGLTESNLTDDANQNIPLSETNPNKQGDGNNGYSLGVFQQQITEGWSTFAPNAAPSGDQTAINQDINNQQAVNQLMTVSYDAEAFLGSPPGSSAPGPLSKGLQNISGWESLQPWVAAQEVQRSADSSGSNYKTELNTAQSLLNQYWNSSSPVPLSVSFTSSGVTEGTACGNGSQATTSGYENPFRAINNLYGQRVDQGVDFDGTGPVYAIGSGVVTNVYNSGWPNGVFINYQLTSGAANGLYVYVAEACTPDVSIGQTVTSSTVLCNMDCALGSNCPGIETGWGSSNNGTSEAMVLNEWDANQNSTGMGVNFLHLLQSLGMTLNGGNNTINPPVQSQGMPNNLPSWQ